MAPVQDNPNENLVAFQPTNSSLKLPPSPSPDTTSTLREPSPDPPMSRSRTSSPTPPRVQAEPAEEQLPGTPFRDESDKPKAPPPTNGRDSPSASAEPGSRLSPAQGVPTKTPHQLSVQTDDSVLRTSPASSPSFAPSIARLADFFTPNRGGSQPGTPQGCASNLRRGAHARLCACPFLGYAYVNTDTGSCVLPQLQVIPTASRPQKYAILREFPRPLTPPIAPPPALAAVSEPHVEAGVGDWACSLFAQYGSSLLPPALKEEDIPAWSLRSMMDRHRVRPLSSSDCGCGDCRATVDSVSVKTRSRRPFPLNGVEASRRPDGDSRRQSSRQVGGGPEVEGSGEQDQGGQVARRFEDAAVARESCHG